MCDQNTKNEHSYRSYCVEVNESTDFGRQKEEAQEHLHNIDYEEDAIRAIWILLTFVEPFAKGYYDLGKIRLKIYFQN